MDDLLDLQKYWLSIGNLQRDDKTIQLWLYNGIEFRSFQILSDLIKNLNCDFDTVGKHSITKSRKECLAILQELDLDRRFTEEETVRVNDSIATLSEQINQFLKKLKL
ncbi:MAG: hypothetical protein H7196_04030 [candidate division SR1 bacterium]|nr:hypothetical protein [candidate division SR1 bacterium]